jgi:predicted lipid carrier protein YhbT
VITTVADARRQLSDGLARVMRGVPDNRLEQAMRTPLRRVALDAIFWQMPQHLDRRGTTGVDATVRWRITGRSDGDADVYDLVIADGRGRISRSGRHQPRLTITLGAAELVRLASGTLDPMQAYFKRRIQLSGDNMLAAKLTGLFRIPKGVRRTDGDPPS